MMDLLLDCKLAKLSPDNLIADFDCGDEDINDFFNNEAILFQQQSLGQTHFYPA